MFTSSLTWFIFGLHEAQYVHGIPAATQHHAHVTVLFASDALAM